MRGSRRYATHSDCLSVDPFAPHADQSVGVQTITRHAQVRKNGIGVKVIGPQSNLSRCVYVEQGYVETG